MRELPEWFEEDRWVPRPESIQTRRLWKFMQQHGYDDYREFLRFSVEKEELFYRTAMTDLQLEWPVDWTQLSDSSEGPEWTKWFVGGRTNLTWLALQRWRTPEHGSRTALTWQGEDGTQKQWSYEELGGMVDQVAAGLRAHGVRDGDVVGMFLPPIPETVVALLAVARIGAITAPAFSGYGADALAERLALVGAKFLITADGYLRRGQEVDMKSVADAALNSCNVQATFVVSRLGRNSLTHDRDHAWEELLQHGAETAYEWFSPEKPWLIAFTSGSSGRPKGAVHCHGRMPYRGSIDFAYCFDMSDKSTLYWPSDMGWIIAPLGVVGSLILGGRHLLYEGSPMYPAPDTIFQLVDQHGITHLGSSPTLIRQLTKQVPDLVEQYSLQSLEVTASAGEPMTSAAWRWWHKHVGRGLRPLMHHTGGTEIGCGLLSGSPIVPMRECRFAGPPPGIAVQVVDATGARRVGEIGDLAVAKPWPSMTLGFWNEPERWTATYTSPWPGLYIHGDRAIEYPDGSWELPGRSDDLLKVAGKRIGPSEYETVALGVAGVVAAAAIGLPDPLKGEKVVLLVEISPEAAESGDTIVNRIHNLVETSLGKAFRPAAVILVGELPLTRNAKVHRRALRAWLTNAAPGDLSSLENPESKSAVLQAADMLEQQR
jgi:acetyl-CoA synthetase